MTAAIRSLVLLGVGAAHAPAAEPPFEPIPPMAVAANYGDKDSVVHAPAFGYYPTQWRSYPGQPASRPVPVTAVAAPPKPPVDRSPPPVQRVYPPDAKPLSIVPINPASFEAVGEAPPGVSPLLPVGATVRGTAPEREQVAPPAAVLGIPKAGR